MTRAPASVSPGPVLFDAAPRESRIPSFTLAPEATPEQQVRDGAEAFRRDFAAVRGEIAGTVVGQAGIIGDVLTCLFCSGHVLLEGVPGIGKTLLVRTLGRALSLGFSRIQFTPDLMPADITGTTIVAEEPGPGGSTHRRFTFQPGPVFSPIVLADEINRATPKTQSALLEAMQERSVTVGGTTHPLPAPFMVLATQNPIEQEGTYPLPEAQLDRFFFKLLVTPPGRADLAEILDRTTGSSSATTSPVLDAPRIEAHASLLRRVPISPHVRDYAVRLVLATHPRAAGGVPYSTPMVDRYVRLGASPRAAQALVLAGKCRALVEGRYSVSIDDLRAAAPAAMRHRLIMNFESHAEGITPDAVIENLIATLPPEAP